MKKISLMVLILACFIGESLFAQQAICQKCQRIREYNEAHPENNYEWYDDYLKDHPEESQKQQKDQ